MCCQPPISFVTYNAFEVKNDSQKVNIHRNSAPEDCTDTIIHGLKQITLTEKIAEIIDLSFHLFKPVFLKVLNNPTYNMLNELHKGAHHLEHCLHTFCFLGDIASIVKRKFIVYHADQHCHVGHKNHHHHEHPKKVNYIATAGRVIHTVSHFFATATFLKELNLVNLGKISGLARYHLALSAVGFGLSTLSIVMNRKSYSDLQSSAFIISLSGLLFDSLEYISAARPIKMIGEVAGLVHAVAYMYLHSPKTHENVTVRIQKTP